MQARRSGTLVVIAAAMLLGGCGGGSPCDKPQQYHASTSRPPLRVPEGLSEPQGEEPLVIPDVKARSTQATGGCLDEPPRFFADARYTRDEEGQLRTASDPRIDIRAALVTWAQAWADRDAEAFFTHYTPGFTPESGQSRGLWEHQMRQHFDSPEYDETLQVSLSQLEIDVDSETRATARFVQRVGDPSGGLRKEMVLVLEDGAWLIRSERVLEVL